jgi:hypothetical protein
MKHMALPPRKTYSLTVPDNLSVDGAVNLGDASTDIIEVSGRLLLRELGSDPLDGVPANRPAGTIGETALYSNGLYICTNDSTPTWATSGGAGFQGFQGSAGSQGFQGSAGSQGFQGTAATTAIRFSFDGGGLTLPTGTQSVPYLVTEGSTITGWTVLGNQSGSIVFDIYRDTIANHPPTSSDSITASDKPQITTGFQNSGSSLTGWQTTLNVNDVLITNIDSNTGMIQAQLIIKRS